MSCRKCKFHYLPICEATNWAIIQKPYSNDAKVKKTLQSQVSRQHLLCFFSGNVAPALSDSTPPRKTSTA